MSGIPPFTPTFATEQSDPNEKTVDTAVGRCSGNPALTLVESVVRHSSVCKPCRRRRGDVLPPSSDANRTACQDFSALSAEGSTARAQVPRAYGPPHRNHILLHPTVRPNCCHRCRRPEKRKRGLCSSYRLRTPAPIRNDLYRRRVPRRPVHCSWICVKTLYVIASWFTSLLDTDLKLQLGTRRSERASECLSLPRLVLLKPQLPAFQTTSGRTS